MKKLSKKGVLLFAAAMALCAFVMPSMASAASWGQTVNQDHTLDSSNFGFTQSLGGGVTSSCTRSSFTATVASTQNLEITSATFGGLCTYNTVAAGRCTLTEVGTRFPWTATPVSTENIQIHGVHIDIRFEHIPGEAAGCGLNGVDLTMTGTLTTGHWTGNSAGQHSLDFSDAEGLAVHSSLGNGVAVTVRANINDTQQSLFVTG
jgi:hypothetical protein